MIKSFFEKYSLGPIITIGVVVGFSVINLNTLSDLSIQNLDSNKQSALALGSVDPSLSIKIFTLDARFNESLDIICKDSTKCISDNIKTSQKSSYTITAKRPYEFSQNGEAKNYYTFSWERIYTPSFARSYGVTGKITQGYVDQKERKGSITRTLSGPNGSTNTSELLVPPAYDFYGTNGFSDNTMGSDTSSNWTASTNGKTVDGVWETYSFSGNSKIYLTVNGSLNKNYMLTLSSGAIKWRLSNANDYLDFIPHHFENGDEIPCDQVKIMGNKLDKNCKVQILVSKGGTYDITPRVDTSYTPRYVFFQPNLEKIQEEIISRD